MDRSSTLRNMVVGCVVNREGVVEGQAEIPRPRDARRHSHCAVMTFKIFRTVLWWLVPILAEAS